MAATKERLPAAISYSGCTEGCPRQVTQREPRDSTATRAGRRGRQALLSPHSPAKSQAAAANSQYQRFTEIAVLFPQGCKALITHCNIFFPSEVSEQIQKSPGSKSRNSTIGQSRSTQHYLC